ncbi:MAG: branched-chain amino acid transporter substrate-binding protein [Conexibacter sp.]|nr:branched-chain amino acid transporter substrate-binding protein [Conexibacter sp.]
MSLNTRVTAALLTAAAIFAGGCGSDDGDSASSGSGPASTAAVAAPTAAKGTPAAGAATCGTGSGTAASGAPIKVGAIVTRSGGVDFSSASNGAQAYFTCLNANGGIGGKPVKYITADDGNDPQKSGAAAAKLVKDDGVVAMVGNQSFTDCLVNPKTYASAKLLSLMAVGLQGACFQSSQIIPMNAGPRLSTISTAQVAKDDGKKKVALVVSEIPGFTEFVSEGLKGYLEANDMELVKTVTAAPGVKDATAVVLGVKAANPDAVVITMPLPDTVTIMKAAEQQQLTKTAGIYCPTSCYDTALSKLAGAAADSAKIDIEFSPLDATTPDTALWSQSMDRYAKGKSKDSFSQGGFLAAKLFSDSLQDVKGTVDRAAVVKAVTAQAAFTSDLVCRPFDLTVDGSKGYNPNKTTREVQLKDGAFEPVKDCFDAEDPKATG